MSNWELDYAVNRVFDDFIKDLNVARRGGARSGHVKAWTPAIDVHETDKEFVIHAELPVCILFFCIFFSFPKLIKTQIIFVGIE